MLKYFTFFLIASVIILGSVLFLRSLAVSDNELEMSDEDEKVNGETYNEFSISELFEEKFKNKEFLSITPPSGKNSETCELFGEKVKEETVIFDSTCYSNEER